MCTPRPEPGLLNEAATQRWLTDPPPPRLRPQPRTPVSDRAGDEARQRRCPWPRRRRLTVPVDARRTLAGGAKSDPSHSERSFLHFFCWREQLWPAPAFFPGLHPQLAGRFGRNMHDGTASFEHERCGRRPIPRSPWQIPKCESHEGGGVHPRPRGIGCSASWRCDRQNLVEGGSR